MKPFYKLLANTLVANITNFFVFSSVIYWVYLTTQSVLGTSLIAGIYLVTVVFSGFWFGSIVDHRTKKSAIIISSIATLSFFIIALVIFVLSPESAFTTLQSFPLWAIVISLLMGSISGNIRSITLPTVVTILVPEEKRDRANGIIGTVTGISFAVSNVAAGVAFGFFGMLWVLIIAVTLTALALIHMCFITIPENKNNPEHVTDPQSKKIDIKGTIKVVRAIPGLFPLIFFTTFNNFLGGVFMALMDAYGLSLVSVQVWGTLWGFLSFGFIVGGIYIAKRGIGKNPVQTLFRANSIIWALCAVMTLQPSIILLSICMFLYLCIAPFIEASEQTIIQKVVPYERQGRVFGFAQSVEQAAAPITAFLIGPIAQFVFIPFMTKGRGVELIGSWYGTGDGRGIGLVFIIAGIIGLITTIITQHSKASKNLSVAYQDK